MQAQGVHRGKGAKQRGESRGRGDHLQTWARHQLSGTGADIIIARASTVPKLWSSYQPLASLSACAFFLRRLWTVWPRDCNTQVQFLCRWGLPGESCLPLCPPTFQYPIPVYLDHVGVSTHRNTRWSAICAGTAKRQSVFYLTTLEDNRLCFDLAFVLPLSMFSPTCTQLVFGLSAWDSCVSKDNIFTYQQPSCTRGTVKRSMSVIISIECIVHSNPWVGSLWSM